MHWHSEMADSALVHYVQSTKGVILSLPSAISVLHFDTLSGHYGGHTAIHYCSHKPDMEKFSSIKSMVPEVLKYEIRRNYMIFSFFEFFFKKNNRKRIE